MECPSCKGDLEKTNFYNTEADFCPKCLGIWFDENELRWAKDENDENLNWLDIDLWEDRSKFKISRSGKNCPWCRLPLYETNYGDSEIKIDLCNVCHGVWLDRGEFRKIIDYLKKKEKYEILNNYLKNLSGEFWEIFTGPESLREEVLDFLTILKILNYKFLIKTPILTSLISNLPK